MQVSLYQVQCVIRQDKIPEITVSSRSEEKIKIQRVRCHWLSLDKGGGRKNFNNLRHLTLLLLRPWEILQQNYAAFKKTCTDWAWMGGNMCIWFPKVHNIPKDRWLTWTWSVKCKREWEAHAGMSVLQVTWGRYLRQLKQKKKGEGLKHVRKDNQIIFLC